MVKSFEIPLGERQLFSNFSGNSRLLGRSEQLFL
jgi:hypothetical protein